MRVIRNSCFETNSSSMHSIVVTKNDIHVTTEDLISNNDNPEHIYISEKGEMSFWSINDGYGRSPFELLATFRDKLQYAMCEFLGYKYVDDPEFNEIYGEFFAIAQELIPNLQQFYIMDKEVDIYLDENGNDIPQKDLIYDGFDFENNRGIYVYKDDNGEKHEATLDEEYCMSTPDIGRIDHQSAGILRNFIKSHGITLKEFLTNKKYIIVIDGDEYDTFGTLKNSGLINLDNIVEEYNDSNDGLIYLKWKKEHEDEESDKE